MDEHQFPLPLVARSTDEILRDQLTEAEELFNTEQDAAVRVETIARIRKLRTLLGEKL